MARRNPEHTRYPDRASPVISACSGALLGAGMAGIGGAALGGLIGFLVGFGDYRSDQRSLIDDTPRSGPMWLIDPFNLPSGVDDAGRPCWSVCQDGRLGWARLELRDRRLINVETVDPQRVSVRPREDDDFGTVVVCVLGGFFGSFFGPPSAFLGGVVGLVVGWSVSGQRAPR